VNKKVMGATPIKKEMNAFLVVIYNNAQPLWKYYPVTSQWNV
jgi:hypothetical protein